MIFVNPLDLIKLEKFDLSKITQSFLKRQKTLLLNEIALSDDGYYSHKGVKLSKLDVENYFEKLKDEEIKYFYLYLIENGYLNDFLTNGHLKYFDYYREEQIYKYAKFIDFISPFYAYNYNQVLCTAVKNGASEVVKKIVSIPLMVNYSFIDKAYHNTYHFIKEWTILTSKNLDEKLIRIGAIRTNVNLECINSLPDYFQEVRNELGSCVRSIAVDIYNNSSNRVKAFEAYKLANEILTNGIVRKRIVDDSNTIGLIIEEKKEAPTKIKYEKPKSRRNDDDENETREKNTQKNKNYVPDFIFRPYEIKYGPLLEKLNCMNDQLKTYKASPSEVYDFISNSFNRKEISDYVPLGYTDMIVETIQIIALTVIEKYGTYKIAADIINYGYFMNSSESVKNKISQTRKAILDYNNNSDSNQFSWHESNNSKKKEYIKKNSCWFCSHNIADDGHVFNVEMISNNSEHDNMYRKSVVTIKIPRCTACARIHKIASRAAIMIPIVSPIIMISVGIFYYPKYSVLFLLASLPIIYFRNEIKKKSESFIGDIWDVTSRFQYELSSNPEVREKLSEGWLFRNQKE